MLREKVFVSPENLKLKRPSLVPWTLDIPEFPQQQNSSCNWSPSLQPLTRQTNEVKERERERERRSDYVCNKMPLTTTCEPGYLCVCVNVPSEKCILLCVHSFHWRWFCTLLHIDSRFCWRLENITVKIKHRDCPLNNHEWIFGRINKTLSSKISTKSLDKPNQVVRCHTRITLANETITGVTKVHQLSGSVNLVELESTAQQQ